MNLRLTAILVVPATPTIGQGALPEPARTAVALNPEVTQDIICSTICVRGWTQTVRPRQQYTGALKRQQIREFGYADRRMGDHEEDHLVPRALGGNPTDPRNLWPEPRVSPDGWGADLKDKLEAVLARLVCAGRVPASRRSGRSPPTTVLCWETEMLATAAAFLMIVLPGSYVPSKPYATVAALDQFMQSGHGLYREVPGFRASCEPSGPELMS